MWEDDWVEALKMFSSFIFIVAVSCFFPLFFMSNSVSSGNASVVEMFLLGFVRVFILLLIVGGGLAGFIFMYLFMCYDFDLRGRNRGLHLFFFSYIPSSFLVLFALSFHNAFFAFVNMSHVVVCVVIFAVIGRSFIKRENEEKLAHKLNVTLFDEMRREIRRLRDAHVNSGTRVAADLGGILEAIILVDEKTFRASRVERHVLAARVADGVRKVSFIAGESYYLSMVDDPSRWEDVDVKMVEVEDAVKDFRGQMCSRLVEINERFSSGVEGRLRRMGV